MIHLKRLDKKSLNGKPLGQRIFAAILLLPNYNIFARIDRLAHFTDKKTAPALCNYSEKACKRILLFAKTGKIIYRVRGPLSRRERIRAVHSPEPVRYLLKPIFHSTMA
jgi:hypothetical protein